MSTCSSCGAVIVDAMNVATGRYLPLDPKAAAHGNVAREGGTRGGALLVRVLKKGEDHPDPLRFVTHFVTCPNADLHRKTRPKGATRVGKARR